MRNHEQSVSPSKFILLADHPALDLLNTVPMVNGELIDLLQSDADVLLWLKEAGLQAEGMLPDASSSALLHAARALRDALRQLLEVRKQGRRADLSVLNAFLVAATSYPQLVWNKTHTLTIRRVWQLDTPEQMLAPVAESAAELLTTVDLDLVKPCEDESCVLWFYDQTKSHHRRWCSMTTCGNRHKVAAYRKRRLDQGI